jgi:hypothetical protein
MGRDRRRVMYNKDMIELDCDSVKLHMEVLCALAGLNVFP